MAVNPLYSRIPYVPGITGSSFKRFYPFYLGEHSNATCRRLHVLGTTFVIALLTASLFTFTPKLLLYVPLVGYGAAWIGHMVFEKNKPATFKHPLYSLAGDLKLWQEVLMGKRAF
jgi:hypothetical protein